MSSSLWAFCTARLALSQNKKIRVVRIPTGRDDLGLNPGLALMALLTLFPGGVLQMVDAVSNGYWHARSPAFMGAGLMKWIEWAH